VKVANNYAGYLVTQKQEEKKEKGKSLNDTGPGGYLDCGRGTEIEQSREVGELLG